MSKVLKDERWEISGHLVMNFPPHPQHCWPSQSCWSGWSSVSYFRVIFPCPPLPWSSQLMNHSLIKDGTFVGLLLKAYRHYSCFLLDFDHAYKMRFIKMNGNYFITAYWQDIGLGTVHISFQFRQQSWEVAIIVPSQWQRWHLHNRHDWSLRQAIEWDSM